MEKPDPVFEVEVLKLLLQVAWSDGEVRPAEARQVLALATRWGLPRAELEALAAALSGNAKLPPPNLGFLRLHRDRAIQSARALASADGTFCEDEQEVLRQIETLLA